MKRIDVRLWIAAGMLAVAATAAWPQSGPGGHPGRPAHRERADRPGAPGGGAAPGAREQWREQRRQELQRPHEPPSGGTLSKEERRELQRDLHRANRELYRPPPPPPGR